jgi:hypothetical protein
VGPGNGIDLVVPGAEPSTQPWIARPGWSCSACYRDAPPRERPCGSARGFAERELAALWLWWPYVMWFIVGDNCEAAAEFRARQFLVLDAVWGTTLGLTVGSAALISGVRRG